MKELKSLTTKEICSEDFTINVDQKYIFLTLSVMSYEKNSKVMSLTIFLKTYLRTQKSSLIFTFMKAVEHAFKFQAFFLYILYAELQLNFTQKKITYT